MSSRRIVAAALVSGAALLLAPQALPAQAQTAAEAIAPTRVAANPLIQGVVVDPSGHPVDDVTVKAIDEDGDVAASALTYASDREDGPQHGYFFVEVPRGSYTIRLSKSGYQTVEYAAGRITRQVKKISMGEIEIAPAAARTTTSAKLVEAKVTTKERGAVVVTVKTGATKKPTGAVEVREGRAVVGEATLVAKGKGTVTVTLDKLAKGKHVLKAYFLGTEDLKKSASQTVTLKVVKK